MTELLPTSLLSPWRAEKPPKGRTTTIYGGPCKFVIAKVSYPADAAMILALPDMVHALFHMVNAEFDDEMDIARDAARDALQKAGILQAGDDA